MLTGNKGEWSEVYTLLKVLGDKKLYAGDNELELLETLVYPVIKIMREESAGTFVFAYEDNLVLIEKNGSEIKIPVTEFKRLAEFLLKVLQNKTDRTFSVPEIEEFLASFESKSLKAKSTVKSDIQIKIHDPITGFEPELGFSIKSKLGGSSTLLNAGKTTNFIFEIKNVVLNDPQIAEINQIEGRSKIQNRIKSIMEIGGVLGYVGMDKNTFESNLVLIDSYLPQIVAESLLIYYSSSINRVTDITSRLKIKNPVNFPSESAHPFYEYKFKRFLTDIALGMMPSVIWDGQLDATGGYLVVKENGDIVCYHIYNRNEFENYLILNTRFETASSSRHDFGKIYKEGDRTYIKLNLQIRFI